MEKTHWKKVFDSDYLGACDIDEGKDLKAIIKSVEIRAIKGTSGEKQERNIAIFTDAAIKPMVLNATNCKLIKKFAGSAYIEDWKNVSIQIYVKSDIKAFGEITDGLRISEIQPKMTKPELLPNSQAWEKAKEYVKSGKGTIADVQKKYDITVENIGVLTEQIAAQ